MKRRLISFAATFTVILMLSGLCHAKGERLSIKRAGWHGGNAALLSRMIASHGRGGADFDSGDPPVAAFDWDNTVIKNDVGDAVLFWMLANNKILQPRKRDWSATSPLLTDEAVSALSRACALQGRPGRALITNQPDSKSVACADEILSIYDSGRTTDGAVAWREGSRNYTMEPAYAWAASLQAGYTPNEVGGFAEQAIAFNLGNETGAVQRIGSDNNVTACIRIYDQIQELISAMQAQGFEVWVVSASSQPVVEAFAARAGIAQDRVIGVRALLDKKGRMTPFFQGCGPYRDGNYGIISYRQGKRCWLNKLVFDKTESDSQMNCRSSLVFAAGDSDTDLEFLKDAEYRLVINRNRPELMCHAYAGMRGRAGSDGVWIVNPMFIEPMPKRVEPYDCSKFSIPDQADLVY